MPDLLGLAGQNAIVVGAGRGSGRAMAVLFAKAGMQVAVVDQDRATAAETVRMIEAEGVRGLALEANAIDEPDLEHAVAAARDALGPLRVGVNNVGNFGAHASSPVLEQGWEFWQTAIDQNLRTCFNVSRTVSRRMIADRVPGALVFIASLAGLRGSPNLAPYGAVKAGVIQFTQTLALELAPHRIRVNCVGPTAIDGPMLRERLTEASIQRRRDAIPLGRIASPEDIAGAVLMLASDLAGFVTGQTVMADGGVSCTSQRPSMEAGEARVR